MSHGGAARRKSSNTTWIIVIVAVCIGGPVLVCGGIALLLPAVSGAREAARRAECKDRMHNIAIALHNYHEVYGTFPPAYVADKNSKPMHSWRVLLLPMLEQKPLYDRYRFDEPWDSPHNRSLAREMPEVFRCPSAPAGSRMTHYVAVVGPKTMFPGQSGVRIRDIRDGAAGTLLIVEAPKEPVHWMKPGDISPEQFLQQMAEARIDGGLHRVGSHVVLADGSVRLLSADVGRDAIQRALTRNANDGAPGFD